MSFLRLAADYGRMDQKRDVVIEQELNTFVLCGKMNEYRKTVNKHIRRLPTGRIPRKLFYYHPGGKGERGRPMKKWKEQFL
jgi:hypothetical protein